MITPATPAVSTAKTCWCTCAGRWASSERGR